MNMGEGGKGKRGRTVSDDVGGKSLSDMLSDTERAPQVRSQL